MRLALLALLLFLHGVIHVDGKKCRSKARAAQTLNDIEAGSFSVGETSALRRPIQSVYLWPSLTEEERALLKEAFFQIGRRTCIKFEELEYKPWYHAERWNEERPYILIRKSKKYAAYSDNTVEGIVGRTILYVSESAFEQESRNQSRGVIMDQLVRFMGEQKEEEETMAAGLKRELLRPDAASYIQPVTNVPALPQPAFHPAQLKWPFDPESITVPLWARERYRLTEYCPARNDQDIGGGQRLNSMYCPKQVPVNASPREGPCVVPRLSHIDDYRRKFLAFQARKTVRKH